MLTPAAPAAWNSRASSPGRSGMTDLDDGELARPRRRACRGSGPRPPGRGRAAPRRPCPARPPSASMRAASARSAATAASTSATGAALADRIWVHRPVSPGRDPGHVAQPLPGQLERLVRGACSSRAAIAAATRCGACEMSATQRSCAAGSVRTGTAAARQDQLGDRLGGLVRGLGQRAQRPGPAEEQVRAGGRRAVLLPAGQRMPGHVAGQVAAEVPGLRHRAAASRWPRRCRQRASAARLRVRPGSRPRPRAGTAITATSASPAARSAQQLARAQVGREPGRGRIGVGQPDLRRPAPAARARSRSRSGPSR